PGSALGWVAGPSRAKGRGLAADIQRLQEDAGSRAVRLIEVEGYIAPFCGFGADGVVRRDYADIKQVVSRPPLRRSAAGPLSYAVASATRSLPSFFFRR